MQIPDNDTIYLITRNGMGNGPEELRIQLIQTFLRLLLENDIKPAALCLYTEGVYLASEQSPVLINLQALESSGVRIILCSTCINYFGLRDKIRVGIPGGMTDILEAMRLASKVITL